jgi:hypothetical protein
MHMLKTSLIIIAVVIGVGLVTLSLDMIAEPPTGDVYVVEFRGRPVAVMRSREAAEAYAEANNCGGDSYRVCPAAWVED